VIGVVLALATSARAESWADKMFKDGVEYNFGNVPHGAQLYHRFVITNIYAVPLQILKVRSSCICGTPSSSTEAIAPRETGFVDLAMDARKFTGPKSITIFVTIGSGTPEYLSTAELKITANSRTDIVFNPGQVNFGVVSAGQKVTQTIDVEYAGALDWQVEKEVVVKDAPLEATVKPLYKRPGQIGYQVAVTLKPDAPSGLLKQDIFLKTNDPASPLVPVLVEANVQASLTISPDKVSYNGIKVGEVNLRRVVLRSGSVKPFQITAIDGLGNGLEVENGLPKDAATVHSLTLRCKVDKEGEFKRELQIMTDMQEKPIILQVEGNTAP
jgi:hypothetical protein